MTLLYSKSLRVKFPDSLTMFSRRLFLWQIVLLLTACKTAETSKLGKLSMGVVSYGEDDRSIEQYSPLVDYLQAQLKTIIELEPAYNEIKALEQIKRKNWSLVFAPPGLAAIAIFEEQYSPLFPLEGVEKMRSLIVVREESPFKKLTDLKNQTMALGQPGSATGYSLPLYNLYGLTLAGVRIAPTPKTILEWIDKKEVAAGALSLADLERYRQNFKQTNYRVIHSSSVPPGAIIVGPMVELYQQERIRKTLASASQNTIQAAGYLTNSRVPEYKALMEIIAKVRPLAGKIKDKPVYLHK
ncbi:ABC-type phosphate/phosphonate transport system, periplasmic component [Allocoleopsis franciscana PCC 7113]|uniref:ABC-type phosphate/phosphonate transport system, periplasmic component n=2 Tax=Allocoleopsis TaxID=2886347 RepID=K9WIX1_9CYAN|nr:ABC-type phosphate/phosphonate transport system, periplasmic component [Allocoleopsis franciscana PCC 7113]